MPTNEERLQFLDVQERLLFETAAKHAKELAEIAEGGVDYWLVRMTVHKFESIRDRLDRVYAKRSSISLDEGDS